MTSVCYLIEYLVEYLDVTEDYPQFAQEAEQFGDDLEQAWEGIENGANLLWLAAAVGVEPRRIIATARELLAEVFEQIETAGSGTSGMIPSASVRTDS
ncbi:hypothetical protein ccbrp13_40990 [Ktedonobacteria bacterium brp13]|nr:hypothetical protein ccbrp13_40990 [Ktedonobacteria bacterium brp13]